MLSMYLGNRLDNEIVQANAVFVQQAVGYFTLWHTVIRNFRITANVQDRLYESDFDKQIRTLENKTEKESDKQ